MARSGLAPFIKRMAILQMGVPSLQFRSNGEENITLPFVAMEEKIDFTVENLETNHVKAGEYQSIYSNNLLPTGIRKADATAIVVLLDEETAKSGCTYHFSNSAKKPLIRLNPAASNKHYQFRMKENAICKQDETVVFLHYHNKPEEDTSFTAQIIFVRFMVIPKLDYNQANAVDSVLSQALRARVELQEDFGVIPSDLTDPKYSHLRLMPGGIENAKSCVVYIPLDYTVLQCKDAVFSKTGIRINALVYSGRKLDDTDPLNKCNITKSGTLVQCTLPPGTKGLSTLDTYHSPLITASDKQLMVQSQLLLPASHGSALRVHALPAPAPTVSSSSSASASRTGHSSSDTRNTTAVEAKKTLPAQPDIRTQALITLVTPQWFQNALDITACTPQKPETIIKFNVNIRNDQQKQTVERLLESARLPVQTSVFFNPQFSTAPTASISFRQPPEVFFTALTALQKYEAELKRPDNKSENIFNARYSEVHSRDLQNFITKLNGEKESSLCIDYHRKNEKHAALTHLQDVLNKIKYSHNPHATQYDIDKIVVATILWSRARNNNKDIILEGNWKGRKSWWDFWREDNKPANRTKNILMDLCGGEDAFQALMRRIPITAPTVAPRMRRT